MNDPAFNTVPEKQRANIYTMMLLVSFICLSIGCLMMYLEAKQFGGDAIKPWKVPDELRAK